MKSSFRKNETVSVNEAAEIMGLSTRTIYRLIKGENLEGEQEGRDWYISLESIFKYLKKKKKNTSK